MKGLQQRKKLSIAVKKLFDCQEGEMLIKHLIRENHVLTGTYSDNTNAMIYREGRRSCVVDILCLLHEDIDTINKIMEEMKADESDGVDGYVY